MATARFAEAHRDSVQEYHERQNQDILFPLKDALLALSRAEIVSPEILSVLKSIKQKQISLPKELLFQDKNGQEFFNLSVLENPGIFLFRELQKIPGLLELFQILAKDLTLSAQNSPELKCFKERRKQINESVRDEVIGHLNREVDYEYELVGEFSKHFYETPEKREKYLEIQKYLQGMSELLFAAAGMKQFLPQVRLTRSWELNAFVFADKPNISLEELLKTATPEEPVQLPIYIHFGLVDTMQSPDELAGVLAHEFSHLLQPKFLGSKAVDEKQRLEYDADATGMKIADAAGFSPRGMLDLLKRISQLGNTNLLQQFGWGTHPDTNRRIIELEKVFNSPDHIFPNAEKKTENYPQNIQEALLTVKKTPKRNSRNEHLLEKERRGQLEETLEQLKGYEIFFASENVGEILTLGQERLRDEILAQELAHGTLGYRDLLVEHMKTYLWALELEKNKKEDDLNEYKLFEDTGFTWVYNSDRHPITELDESVFDIPEQKQYLARGEEETVFGLTEDVKEHEKKKSQEDQKKVQSLLKDGVQIGCSTFEDFIDENNVSSQKFWEALLPQNKRGVPLTRGQKLQLFKRLLGEFLTQQARYSNHGNSNLFQVRVEYEREFSVEVPVAQKLRDNILQKVPVDFRAHRKDEETGPKTQTITQKQTESVVIFSSQKRTINTPYRLWELSPDEQPPLLKNVTALVQEKTIDAFREILIEDGMSDSEVGKDELSFILRCLQTDLIPFSIQRVSIPFLSRVIALLERKKITDIFGGNRTMIDQRRINHFRDYFTGIIAFGLKAKNEEEISLQNTFRREIEINPNRYGTCIGGIGKRKDLHLEDWEEKHLRIAPQSEGDPNNGEDNVGLEINAPKNLAVTERVWADNKDRVLKFFETGKPLGLESGTPPEFRSFEISEKDIKSIEGALGSFLQNSGKFSAMEKKLFEPLLRFVVASRQFLSYTYREELLTNDSVNKIFEKEKERLYPTLELFVEEVAERLFSEYGEKIKFFPANEKKRGMKKDDYKKLLSHVLAWMATTINFLERAAQVNAIQGDPSVLRVYEDINPVKERRESDEWYEFRPASLHLKAPSEGEYSFPSIALETITHRLEILSKENSSAKKLLEKILLITKEKGKQCLPDSIMRACLGQLSKFSRTRRGFGKEVEIQEMIVLWRLVQEVYKDEWKNIEQYKRFDEQMAHWEWLYGNPFETLRVTEIPGLSFDKKNALQKENQEAISKHGLIGFIEEKFVRDNFIFRGRYKVDDNDVSDISFSWPLFIDDLWNGVDIVEKCCKSDSNEDRERVKTIFDYIQKELHIIVKDKNNWDRVKNMQPGFFREFFVAKKLEIMNLKTLEEIEPYLQYFESHSHEGSERNQVSALIEGKKYTVTKEKKKSLYEVVCREFGVHPERDKIFFQDFMSVWNRGSGETNILSDRDFDITIEAGSPQTTLDLRDKMIRRYWELLTEAELQREQSYLPDEEEVFVFSDHIIENDQSRLEIGPTYRLRFAAQPLMDWHKNALESCVSLTEAEALSERINTVLPERHPLKDLFVKNQMAHEIWQLLTDHIDLSSLREMGIRFMSTSVHLPDALQKFPLYHEVSFLKNYTLYEVEGLGNAIEQLPQHITSEILRRIEKMYREQVSPDQAPTIRRLLFDLEKKITWPGLRVAQKNGEEKFESTLERVLNFYKEPTFERDQILLDICMDLATSPEQIRKVWSYTRNEQMRWPDEREKNSKRVQHETFEKIRGMIGMMERGDRAQYILWMLGGDAPFAEKFSSEETGISLIGRRNVFWHMTPNERRELLYELLLREKGVFEQLKLGWGAIYDNGDDTDVPLSDTGLPRAERAYDMIRYFANNLFDLTFGDQSIDPDKAPDDSTNLKGKEMMQVIFRGMFLHQSESARRAELLINIVEAVGQAKQEERDLSPGELMKLLLEQIGVVGIKAAQILSEQPGLLPESIRKHLAELKDSGKKVSKQVPATYLQSTGWLDTTQELHCTSIEEEVGVASIKQVNRGVLSDGSEVAIKFKRPSIDKSFEQDLKVLRGVLKNLESKNFSIPVYLLDEIEKAIREELSFTHEVDNQMAMKRSLEQRQAKIELPLGDEKSAIPLVVTTPIRIPEVLYPLPETEEDLGLIVEQYVQGLSLKDIQKYNDASRGNDEKTLEKMRERIQRLYGKSRLSEIEKKLQDIDVDRFGANLGLELMRQIIQGGAFHADLHSGNIYIDFTPFTENGELHQAKAVLIDLGSAGYSERENMPLFVKEKTKEDFSAKQDFRDFLTALFAPQIKTKKVAEIVNKYGGLQWDEAKIVSLIGSLEDTSSKVKKIFYSILEEGKTMNDQFRYFLKAIATGAGHLDRLRDVVQQEFAGNGGDDENALLTPKLMNEGLLNMDLLFEF